MKWQSLEELRPVTGIEKVGPGEHSGEMSPFSNVATMIAIGGSLLLVIFLYDRLIRRRYRADDNNRLHYLSHKVCELFEKDNAEREDWIGLDLALRNYFGAVHNFDAKPLTATAFIEKIKENGGEVPLAPILLRCEEVKYSSASDYESRDGEWKQARELFLAQDSHSTIVPCNPA